MTLLDVVIPGDPVGKGRPRCSCRGGKPRMRTPEKTRQWEEHAAEAMELEWRGREPIARPVAVTVVTYRRWPKSRGETVESEPYCTVGNDLDNEVKAILDAMQLAGVLDDDKSVVEVTAAKRWATRGEPRVWVRVRGVRGPSV
ncbi:MAG: RusA family crossover junction endodeoxyribonuclease [Myxococcota bacterium]